MKTPKQWIDEYPTRMKLNEQGFVCATESMESLISAIQKEAYDLGRADGLEEAVSDFKKIPATDPTDQCKVSGECGGTGEVAP
jgi:hypothetical protein